MRFVELLDRKSTTGVLADVVGSVAVLTDAEYASLDTADAGTIYRDLGAAGSRSQVVVLGAAGGTETVTNAGVTPLGELIAGYAPLFMQTFAYT